MEYKVKKPSDAQWADLVTGSLSAEVHAGRIGWNWRIKRAGETREWSVLELAEAKHYGGKDLGVASDETRSRNPPPDALCYLLIGENQKGPYAPDQIRSMWASGEITADTLYWFEGLENWFPAAGFCQRASTGDQSVANTIAGSTIACSYALTILLPLFGFFAGMYLVLKRQVGHGVACMALSVFTFVVLMSIFSH